MVLTSGQLPLMSFAKNTDSEGMATVLELAREVRHRLVSKDTGCLTVDYPDSTVSIHLSDGTVAAERAVFLSCFARNPVDFQFKTMKSRNPDDMFPERHCLLKQSKPSIINF